MYSTPLVSILTPTYNRPEWLPLTLQSLVNQTYENWECIVVNDAGVDVEHIVKQFNDPRIKYFNNEKNLDLAGTRNVAMEKSSGDWYLMLDDDDSLFPEALEFRLWRAKKLNADVVYSRVLQCFYEKQNGQYKYVGEKLYWDMSFDRDRILVYNIAPCNGIMWSRKAQENSDLFDTSLKTGEDWNHSISLSRKYDFYETKIIDCQCSYRTDQQQMTGSRDFNVDIVKIFRKWRHTAIDKKWVIQEQRNCLLSRGLNPKDCYL